MKTKADAGFLLKIRPTYGGTKKDRTTLIVDKNLTLNDLNDLLNAQYSDDFTHLSWFEVGDKTKHCYYSDKHLEAIGYDMKEKHNHELSNDPFKNDHHIESGRFNKTLFQLFVKDGIWKLKWSYDAGETTSYTIEISFHEDKNAVV